MSKNILGFHEVKVRVSDRARRLRLSVGVSGEVVVTVPRRVPRHRAALFVEEHKEWIARAVARMRLGHKKRNVQPLAGRYSAFREPARALVTERLAHFNKFYGLPVNQIRIKNQKTRWGSCSRSGNLNFNYKVALIPAALVDYVVVHELCHLAELNHSPRFWRKMAETIPDYQERRRALREFRLQ